MINKINLRHQLNLKIKGNLIKVKYNLVMFKTLDQRVESQSQKKEGNINSKQNKNCKNKNKNLNKIMRWKSVRKCRRKVKIN